jgi:hypothetical protein
VGIHIATGCFSTIYEFVGWTWEEGILVISRHYPESWLERESANRGGDLRNNSQYDLKSDTFHI